MATLKELEDSIEKIWKNKIRKEVNEELIANERDLLASLYYWLRRKYDNDESISVYTEDPFPVSRTKNGVGDLVIYRWTTPLVLCELKFGPDVTNSIFSWDKKKLKAARDSRKLGVKRGYMMWAIYRNDLDWDEFFESNDAFNSNKTWKKNYLREAQGVIGRRKKDWKIVYF